MAVPSLNSVRVRTASADCGLRTGSPRINQGGILSDRIQRWRMSTTQRLLPQSAVRIRSLHSYASCSGDPIRSPQSALAVRTLS